jgi:hypothetical protein
MNNKLNELFRWSIYYTLDVVSRVTNFVSKLFGMGANVDLGLNWLVWLESRRVEREIRDRESKRVAKQLEADKKIQKARTDMESYGKDIQDEQ